MEIKIFESVTTEQSLCEIEKEAEKYDGLYVEMENSDERKFVKDKASLIGSLLKKIDRVRIDVSKEYKIKVESEAKSIKERLELANKPFTALIEDYKLFREKQLLKEKKLQAAKDLAFQLPLDHDDAILMNKMFNFEIAEKAREQQERDQAIADNAKKEAELKAEQAEKEKLELIEQAKANEIRAVQLAIIEEERTLEAARQAKINAEQAEIKRLADVKQAQEEATQREIDRQNAEKKAEQERLAKLESDKKHVGAVRCEIKQHIMKASGIDEATAVKVVKSLLLTARITVNY